MATKNNIKFNLEFTTSKLLAYVVIITSTVISILLKSADVAIVGLTIGSLLSGTKTVSDNLLKSKVGKILEKETSVTEEDIK